MGSYRGLGCFAGVLSIIHVCVCVCWCTVGPSSHMLDAPERSGSENSFGASVFASFCRSQAKPSQVVRIRIQDSRSIFQMLFASHACFVAWARIVD